MLSVEEVKVDEFYSNASMPFGLALTHIPTGIRVEGNCKTEQARPNVQNTLMNTLSMFVASSEWAKRPRPVQGAPDGMLAKENEYLREQLMNMQIQINQLISPKVMESAVQPIEKVAKKGWTTERKAEAAERMRARQAAKKLLSTEEQRLIAAQMRAPTDAPVVIPKTHRSIGSVAVVVSPEAQAKGYRP